MNTCDLIGLSLDWAVAQAFNLSSSVDISRVFFDGDNVGHWMDWNPSVNWTQGGPFLTKLLEDGLLIMAVDENYRKKMPTFKASLTKWETVYRGETPLIAAFRCYVASIFGDVIEIPPWLL